MPLDVVLISAWLYRSFFFINFTRTVLKNTFHRKQYCKDFIHYYFLISDVNIKTECVPTGSGMYHLKIYYTCIKCIKKYSDNFFIYLTCTVWYDTCQRLLDGHRHKLPIRDLVETTMYRVILLFSIYFFWITFTLHIF